MSSRPKYNDVYIIVNEGKLCGASTDREIAEERAEMLEYQAVKRELAQLDIEDPTPEEEYSARYEVGTYIVERVNLSGRKLSDFVEFYSCLGGQLLVGDIVHYLKADRFMKIFKI